MKSDISDLKIGLAALGVAEAADIAANVAATVVLHHK